MTTKEEEKLIARYWEGGIKFNKLLNQARSHTRKDHVLKRKKKIILK